jgi:uncharacterized SAM-binding protein YcdF (DUF218 family)
MFFVASKILAFLVVPSNILISLIVVGTALLYTRFARTGRRLVVTGAVLIVLVGLSPLGSILLRVLEDRFPAWDATRGAPIGFIVLGGALDPDMSTARRTPVIDGSAERLTIVAELARRYPSARFIYSGGNGNLLGGAAEADHVAPLLESFGIAKDRIVIERNARNTAENAAFSKALAAPKSGDRWVVVTTGTHMPRAIGAFRAAGFDVEAYPVDWRTGGASETFGVYAVFAAGLGTFDAATREFVGLLAYRLTARTSELFPAPR